MKNTLRKIFTFALVVATVVATSGILSVNTVKAAAPDMSLIKMSGLSTVYYLQGGKRYVFPNPSTYMTWYRDFSSVMTISQSELESYPLGGNVTFRPGVNLVKITTDPKVYAVGYGRTLHSIVSEANAISLWGANWASAVRDVPDAFFTNYVVGAPLTAGMYPEGQLVKMANSPNVYYFDGTNYRAFSGESSFMNNRFSFSHVATAPASWTSITPIGSPITSVEPNLTNTAGGASSSASTGSGLSVALAADTPASANLTNNATHVTYTKFNVTASNDGDIVLQSVTVHRSGVGASADFESVYLYDGATRLTTGRSINTSTNVATFNGLSLTIPRGTTKALSIVADMNSTTGTGTSSLGIASASAVTAGGATVSGSFPVMGNMMGLSNIASGTITIAKSGTLSNPKAGETGAKVAEFQLTASSVEDVKVSSLTLYQVGNINNGYLTNFMLKQAGTTVATATGVTSGGNIVLNFTSPFSMDRGGSRTFQLYADVSAQARASDTVRIYVDNDADVHALGQTYGYGVGVTRTDYDNSANSGTDASWSSVEAGQLTMAFQGPAVTDYAVQQQDVELFRFTIAAQSNLEIRNTRVNIAAPAGDVGVDTNDLFSGTAGSGATANYTDIKLVDVSGNAVVAGPRDVAVTAGASDTTQDMVYTDVWNINAGQTRTIKVTADIANISGLDAGETLRVTFGPFQASDVKNLDNNQFVATTDIVPSGAMAGSAHNIDAGSVVATLAGTPSVQTYINGSQDLAMVGVNIAAGTGKDITVSSIKLTATGSADGNVDTSDDCSLETNCVLTVSLWDGATQVGTTKSLVSSADPTATFSNLTLNIAKGTTKTLTAKANLNTLTAVEAGITLEFGVADNATDIVAQDGQGNSVSVSAGSVDGPNHVLASAGTLTVAVGASNANTETRILLAGRTDEEIANFRFTAANESLKVTKLTVNLTSGDADDILSGSLWDGATKVTGDVTVTSAGTPYIDFTSFTGDFIVPKDGSKTLTLKVNTNTTGNGADSGETITAGVATSGFEARGVNNSNTVITNTGLTGEPATGNTMTLRKSKINLTEGTLSSTVGTGSYDVYKFTVTPDGGDVALKQLIFDVTLTDNATTANTLVAGTWKLFRGGSDITGSVDIHNLAGATIESTNTLGEGTAQAIVTWTTEEIISSATTYTLKSTLGDFGSGDGDAIRVLLREDGSVQTSGYTYIADADQTAAQKTASLGTAANLMMATPGASTTLSGNDNIIWSDFSVVGHDSTLTDNVGAEEGPGSSADWINGYQGMTSSFGGISQDNNS